jgi:hypothetical protein
MAHEDDFFVGADHSINEAPQIICVAYGSSLLERIAKPLATHKPNLIKNFS